jgi:FkbM family methyltransferase
MKYTHKIIFITLSLTILQNALYSNPISKEFIQTYLPENPIILEAGAYNGNDTEQMATMWPGCTIYAFEPIPELYESVYQKAVKCPQIKCFNLALSNANGTADFYVSSGSSNQSSSLLKPKEHLRMHPDVEFKTKIHVQTSTLDDWAEQNNVDHIDFMWLDMQGGEYQMLKNSTKILPTVKVIFTEISYIELYEGCPNFPEFKAWMESQGFKLIAENYVCCGWGDALFVRC